MEIQMCRNSINKKDHYYEITLPVIMKYVSNIIKIIPIIMKYDCFII